MVKTGKSTTAAPAGHDSPTAESRLRAAGLRATRARLAVLSQLDAAEHALSHAEIEAGLSGVTPDRVTLYRILDSFVEHGLAVRTVGADRVSRYAGRAAGEHASHAHFLCDDCGRSYCLDIRTPTPRGPHLPEGFRLEGADLTFHGHCPSCLRAASGPTSGSASGGPSRLR